MDPKDDAGVSRRDFLKTVSVASAAVGVTAIVPARTAEGAAIVGPGPVPITLTINGRTHKLEVEPRVTLLDAVRNRLNITGAKRVCDRGACGSCTMIVDGRTVYACSMLAIEAQGKQIRTVEGLSDENGALHPVEQAYVEHDALMCGFCTPGFVTATAALLEKNPNPTPEEVQRALDGNICRCGTYKRLLEAALSTKGVRRG
jgi:xanthine dehydrogenase YagT iron-sulfur-binding subunit